jgi:hypothetical protein
MNVLPDAVSSAPESSSGEETGEEAIFCVHDCHKKRKQFECPTCGGLTTDLKAGAFEHLVAGRIRCQHCGADFFVKDSAASS